MNNIAEKIKNYRINIGISPSELSNISGLSLGYITKLEKGDYKTVSLKTSKMLANGLGISLKDFLEYIGYLENKNDNDNPSLQMIMHALRGDVYSREQVEKIISYAKYVKHEACPANTALQ
ncbi:helix-turn-helix transcriptional regulator [Candidatus Parcubacteria bacterium]|nr:helix-turn-helix transcriptional regulator [Candidatus Parcubacteria bacterium]